MSLFEDASLITTPNAYKAGKLYSIKPTNGDGDLDVVRATTATRVNSAGLIETVANNVPRLDYTNGSCPSILVEPQRTNLLLRSEEFENASWVKSGVTVSANATTAPDGLINADSLIASVAFGEHYCLQFATVTSGIVYSYSIYAKANGYDFLRLGTNANNSIPAAYFDLTLGTVSSIDSGVIALIQNAGNGWYRCTITITANSSGSRYFAAWTTPINSSVFYNGDGTSGIYIWGAQLEQGSNATSYIPTVASAVTRNGDVIGKTGISDLIGQTEGTLFAEFNRKGESPANQLLFGISDGTVNNRLRIITTSDFEVRIRFQLNGNITQYDVTTSGGIINSFEQQVKIAFAYKSGDIAVYINGVLFDSSSNTLTIANTLSEYNMSSTSAGSTISQALLFKTRLTNAQLEALTTL